MGKLDHGQKKLNNTGFPHMNGETTWKHAWDMVPKQQLNRERNNTKGFPKVHLESTPHTRQVQVLLTVRERYEAMLQNEQKVHTQATHRFWNHPVIWRWYHFGVGAPPTLEPILVGIGMFTGGRMGKILKTIVHWYLHGESSFPAFLRWCKISSIHSMGVPFLLGSHFGVGLYCHLSCMLLVTLQRLEFPSKVLTDVRFDNLRGKVALLIF